MYPCYTHLDQKRPKSLKVTQVKDECNDVVCDVVCDGVSGGEICDKVK